jgi:hypothetical protein
VAQTSLVNLKKWSVLGYFAVKSGKNIKNSVNLLKKGAIPHHQPSFIEFRLNSPHRIVLEPSDIHISTLTWIFELQLA